MKVGDLKALVQLHVETHRWEEVSVPLISVLKTTASYCHWLQQKSIAVRERQAGREEASAEGFRVFQLIVYASVWLVVVWFSESESKLHL